MFCNGWFVYYMGAEDYYMIYFSIEIIIYSKNIEFLMRLDNLIKQKKSVFSYSRAKEAIDMKPTKKNKKKNKFEKNEQNEQNMPI